MYILYRTLKFIEYNNERYYKKSYRNSDADVNLVDMALDTVTCTGSVNTALKIRFATTVNP
jgi:hypothetical protein